MPADTRAIKVGDVFRFSYSEETLAKINSDWYRGHASHCFDGQFVADERDGKIVLYNLARVTFGVPSGALNVSFGLFHFRVQCRTHSCRASLRPFTDGEFRINTRADAALLKISKQSGMAVAELIRRAIDVYLKGRKA